MPRGWLWRGWSRYPWLPARVQPGLGISFPALDFVGGRLAAFVGLLPVEGNPAIALAPVLAHNLQVAGLAGGFEAGGFPMDAPAEMIEGGVVGMGDVFVRPGNSIFRVDLPRGETSRLAMAVAASATVPQGNHSPTSSLT